jgi:hypothetical protein
MTQQLDEKISFDGSKVKVLGAEYDPGKPEKKYDWRAELRNRDQILAYLKVGVR